MRGWYAATCEDDPLRERGEREGEREGARAHGHRGAASGEGRERGVAQRGRAVVLTALTEIQGEVAVQSYMWDWVSAIVPSWT